MSNNQLPPQTHIIKPQLRGFFWAYIIFSLPSFLTSVLVLSLVIILTLVSIAGAGSSKSGVDKQEPLALETIQKSKNPNGILIYELSGAITSGNFNTNGSELEINTRKVAKDFEQIKKNPLIKNVVFKFNTPGGELYASEVLGDLITDLQSSKNQSVPNIYFDQLSASGGLFSSYKTKGYIMGSKYGETGSIGVIMKLPNYKGIADKIGYSQTTIKSSASKDIGDPFRDVSPDERNYFQDQLNTHYKRFKDIVASGRKISPNKVEELATGLVFNNQEALQKGLLDNIGDINQLVQKSASEVSLTDYSVYKIEKKSDVLSRFFSGSSVLNIFGASQLSIPTKLNTGQPYLIDELRL